MLPETASGMLHVCAFRHALALDELRVKFLPEYAFGGLGPEQGIKLARQKGTEGREGDIKEVWFVGSHSDVFVNSPLFSLVSII